MPICPECGENIDSLNAWFSTQSKHKFTLDGTAQYYSIATRSVPMLDGFACPRCDATLFGTEAAAIAFLRGGE